MITIYSKHDQKWLSSFNACEEYIRKYSMYPLGNVVYHGCNITNWIRNQKKSWREGSMKEERKKLLDQAIPLWKEPADEWLGYAKKMLKKNWTIYVKKGEHSLLILDEMDRYKELLHKNQIHSCEELLNVIEKQNIKMELEELLRIYKVIYPYISIPHNMFLLDLENIDAKDYEEMQMFFLSFPYNEPEDMEKAVERLMQDLPEKRKDFIRKKYGFKSKSMTLQAIGEMYHLTKESIRQQILKSIYVCRKKKEELYYSNCELDKFKMTNLVKGVLFHNNIRKAEDIVLLKDNVIFAKGMCHLPDYQIQVENFLNSLILLSGEYAKEFEWHINEHPFLISEDKIDSLNLSNLLKNALRRKGLYTIKELYFYCKDKPFKKLMKIRNIGERVAKEAINCLKSYGWNEDFIFDENSFILNILQEFENCIVLYSSKGSKYTVYSK